MDGMNGYTGNGAQVNSAAQVNDAGMGNGCMGNSGQSGPAQMNDYAGSNGQAGIGPDGYIGYMQWNGGGSDAWGQPMVRRSSPEEEVKAARKHFSKLGLMFFLGAVVIFGVQFAASAVYLLKPEWMWDANITLMLSVLPMYLIGMPVLILLVHQVPAEKVEKHSMKAGSFVLAAILCFAIAYISNILGNVMTWIIGALKGSLVQNEIVNITTSVNIWLVLIYMVICAPIMEEYVFRKLIVDRTVRYGQGAAVLMSGLMFGLFHGNLNQFMYAFTLGAFLAFLYVKTGKLKITIALHMMFNFMGGLVSAQLMDMIDIDEYFEVMAGGDMAAVAAYMMDHLVGWIAYFLFLFFVFGVMIAGSVLLIVFLVKRKFVLNRGAVTLPKGKRFSTMFLNTGMILYSLLWIGMIFWQMFGQDIARLVRG